MGLINLIAGNKGQNHQACPQWHNFGIKNVQFSFNLFSSSEVQLSGKIKIKT